MTNEPVMTNDATTTQLTVPAVQRNMPTTVENATGQMAEQTSGQNAEQQIAVNNAQPTERTIATDTGNVFQASMGLVAIVGVNGATVADSPAGTVLEHWTTGADVTAIGRTADNSWLLVESNLEPAEDEDILAELLEAPTVGWVERSALIVFGIDALPIMAPTVAPAASNTVFTTETILGSATLDEETTVSSDVVVDVSENTQDVNTLAGTVTAAASPRLNVRAGAGTTHTIIGKAYPDERYTVQARDETGTWLQIALPDVADSFGWVAADYLQVAGDVMQLPVAIAVSEAPTYRETAVIVNGTSGSQSTTQQIELNTTTLATTQPASPVAVSSNTGLQGTLVFQSSSGGMIYAYHLETGQLQEVTYGFDPAISPDGQRIAFARGDGLYLIDIDGSNEQFIFAGQGISAPKWSPDGTGILFTRIDETSDCVQIGRGGCTSVNSLPPSFDTEDLDVTTTYTFDLARVDLNGENYRELSALVSARAADWNEAGVVYQSSAGLQLTADEPNATTQLLIHDPLKPAYEDPDWQPNGGQIAFVSRSGDHREIYVVNADGSGMTALTRPVTTLVDQLPSNVAPAWSPDGQYIVYLSNRGEDNSAGDWQLWVMNADGTNQRALGIDVSINYTYGNEQVVSWGL